MQSGVSDRHVRQAEEAHAERMPTEACALLLLYVNTGLRLFRRQMSLTALLSVCLSHYVRPYTFGRLVVRATNPALMGATVRDAPHCAQHSQHPWSASLKVFGR